MFFRRSSEITSQMRDQEEYKLKAAEAEQRIKVNITYGPCRENITPYSEKDGTHT